MLDKILQLSYIFDFDTYSKIGLQINLIKLKTSSVFPLRIVVMRQYVDIEHNKNENCFCFLLTCIGLIQIPEKRMSQSS